MNILFLDIETADNPAMVSCLPELNAKANLKDPEKIAADLEEKRAKQRANMALDGDYGQVTAIGWAWNNEAVPTAEMGYERELIATASELIYQADYVITFNGKSFDLPYLWTRARHHGAAMPYPEPDTNKYRDHWHIDVMLLLTYRGAIPAKPMAQYAQVYGVAHNDVLKGSDMPRLYHEGEHDLIAQHVIDDVDTLRRLWRRCGFCVPGRERA